jgi:peptidoglycan/xylan/chitin deacetylase (PgdA/CDA1 family)
VEASEDAAVGLPSSLAKEIVERGHEASGRGHTWSARYSMTPEDERASYQKSIVSLQRATGTRPVGFGATLVVYAETQAIYVACRKM